VAEAAAGGFAGAGFEPLWAKEASPRRRTGTKAQIFIETLFIEMLFIERPFIETPETLKVDLFTTDWGMAAFYTGRPGRSLP
jgi:hypothetical protein